MHGVCVLYVLSHHRGAGGAPRCALPSGHTSQRAAFPGKDASEAPGPAAPRPKDRWARRSGGGPGDNAPWGPRRHRRRKHTRYASPRGQTFPSFKMRH